MMPLCPGVEPAARASTGEADGAMLCARCDIGTLTRWANVPVPAEGADGWYTSMLSWPTGDEIVQQHLGLPPHAVQQRAQGRRGWPKSSTLRLAPGDTSWTSPVASAATAEIAARTGTRLVGVDFSAEAVRRARGQARRLGQGADFRVGN